jgi:hypothetical protein
MRAKRSLVLLVAVLLAGCSSTTGTDPQSPTSSTSSTLSPSRPAETADPSGVIPNGTYSTEVLRAAEVKRGFPASRVDGLIRPEGSKVELKFRDDRWLQFVSDPSSGALVQGDGGTMSYSKPGIVILKNDGGIVATFRWSLEGGNLNLVFVSLAGDPANDTDGLRIMTEHRYSKVA